MLGHEAFIELTALAKRSFRAPPGLLATGLPLRVAREALVLQEMSTRAGERSLTRKV